MNSTTEQIDSFSTGMTGTESMSEDLSEQRLNFYKQDTSKSQLQEKFKTYTDQIRKDKRTSTINRKRLARVPDFAQ